MSSPCWRSVEVDLEGVDFRQETDEILQRTAKPINRPCHDDVELTTSGILAQPVKVRALVTVLRAANAVVPVNLDIPDPRTFGYGA